jgi:hypothetical protein
MMQRGYLPLLVVAIASAGGVAVVSSGCGTSDESKFGAGDADASVPRDDGSAAPDFEPDASRVFRDLPEPIVDADGGANTPPNAGDLFGAAGDGSASGGPCLVEPEVGSLFPRNWLRPRFRWVAAPGQNLFELRLKVANQERDLVVYTSRTTWTMPQAMWDALRRNSADVAMTVSIRGGAFDGTALTGVALGVRGDIGIAPVDAPGTIVYWTTAGGSSLKGFAMGEESVVTTLVPSQVTQRSATCIGCHTSTPDGEFAAFSTEEGSWANALASVNPKSGLPIGAPPSFLAAGAKASIERGPVGISSFSQAHWRPGDRKMIASTPSGLFVLDLEATSEGAARRTLERTGDAVQGTAAGAPNWSHDGRTIVYVATSASRLVDGRLGSGSGTDDNGARADLHAVPYNGGAGGAVTAIPGASDPNVLEYYPAFSPDDTWIAFNRAPNDKNMYDQPLAEVYVVPSSGGTPVRLAANDPPACANAASPGITNSWPKWAPRVEAANGRRYYWLVFSSKRGGSVPQLYVTPMVVAADASVQTFAALYLWNQPEGEGNHTPAWEYFKIPSSPPR